MKYGFYCRGLKTLWANGLRFCMLYHRSVYPRAARLNHAGFPTLLLVQEACWFLHLLCSQRWIFMWNPPPKYVGASAEEYAKDLAIFLAKYAWVFQGKLVEFILGGTWDRVPEEWRDALLGLSYEQMHHLTFDVVCACNCCRQQYFVCGLPHHATFCARRQLLMRDQSWNVYDMPAVLLSGARCERSSGGHRLPTHQRRIP